jgi:hypothetical protein
MIAASITPIFDVLLISGDPAFAAVMRAMIGEHSDHSVTTCDLVAAINALHTRVPTLILIDADSLPTPEAAVSLMTLCADAPVVAVSAARQLSPTDVTALYRAGATSVLFKAGGSSGVGALRTGQFLAQLHAIAHAARDTKKENVA